jgi:hypothetical protein
MSDLRDIDLAQTHLNWCIDIIKRIKSVLDKSDMSESDKVESITWLVKQGLKVEREE